MTPLGRAAAATLALISAAAAWALAPERADTVLRLVVRNPRLSAEAMRDGTARPAERALLAWPAVRSVYSWTSDGTTVLEVALAGEAAGTADVAILAARRRLLASGAEIDTVALAESAAESSPALLIAVGGGETAARSLFALDVLRPALLAVDGVARVEVLGAARPRVAITPLAAELLARQGTAADLAGRLCDLGDAADAGRVLDGATPRALVVRERVRSLAELAAVRVPLGGGTAFLGDLARLEVRAEPEGARVRTAQGPAVLLRVFGRRPGLAERARRRARALPAPAGIDLDWREPSPDTRLLYDSADPQPPAEPEAAGLASVAGVAGGDQAWSVWALDAAPGVDRADLPPTRPGTPRGELLLPPSSGVDRAALAQALAARGLRPVAPPASVLWLSSGTEDGVDAALARLRAAIGESPGLQPIAPPSGGARLRVALRPEIDVADRRAIGDALAAAAGRPDCGRAELPGLWPRMRLLRTSAPRPELLPVRVSGGRTVPLAALAVDVEQERPAPIVRRNGRPAAELAFAGPRDAARAARLIAFADGTGLEVVPVEREAERARPWFLPGAAALRRGALAALALLLAAVAFRRPKSVPAVGAGT